VLLNQSWSYSRISSSPPDDEGIELHSAWSFYIQRGCGESWCVMAADFRYEFDSDAWFSFEDSWRKTLAKHGREGSTHNSRPKQVQKKLHIED
jgi:hypothetical protein